MQGATAGPRAAAGSSRGAAESAVTVRHAPSGSRPDAARDGLEIERGDPAGRLRRLARDGDALEIDHAARAPCWAVHRELARAVFLRAGPLMRRILRGATVAHHIPGAGPGSPRA